MYTYDQLQAMAVHRLGEAPSDKDTLPVGALPGSYGGTALGKYVGLHVHTAMPDQVHVVDGKPTPWPVPYPQARASVPGSHMGPHTAPASHPSSACHAGATPRTHRLRKGLVMIGFLAVMVLFAFIVWRVTR